MWTYRHALETTWKPVQVPSAWQETGLPKADPGPYWFRTSLSFPDYDPEKRYWLRFRAVSYHCEIFVNGLWIGEHLGAWDRFSVEITPALTGPGGDTEILVRVTKPASLTAGPDSPHVPGAYPLRETLAGFLPYVWGHAIGGLWQPVELYTTGLNYMQDAFIRGDSEGRLHLQATLAQPASLHLQILDPTNQSLLSIFIPSSLKIDNSQFTINHFIPYTPASPALYTARLTIPNGDTKTLRFGFRTLTAEGSTLRLNGEPVFPRFILSWGWYPARMCPDPGPEQVRADFARLRALGYNGVKLCLWFPPQYYFGLADELGMLLWVEFPIWLPQVTEFFRTQTPLEIERLTRLARQHPSVMLYTLGCELGPDVDAEFLRTLYHTVKALIGDALLTGNSGSGEAYGGPLDESADFYDHHFYTDPPFLASLYDTFAPHWRAPKPWLMGEFNDFDTLRNWPALLSSSPFPLLSPAQVFPLWWLMDTPQGARWAMEVYLQADRLKALGLWDRTPDLYQLSLEKALLHRKLTLETLRARPALSGYVITGEADIPISTAGMWDDLGQTKFTPEQFRRFNADTILLISFPRRRAWVAGGDRPVYRDRFCYQAGEEVRVSILLSHFGQDSGRAVFRWEICLAGALLMSGEGVSEQEVFPGSVQEIGVVKFQVPEVSVPSLMSLRVATNFGGTKGGELKRDEIREAKEDVATESVNEWPFWFFPKDVWRGVEAFGWVDLAERLGDLERQEPALCVAGLAEGRVAVVTQWTGEIAQFVEQGGRAVVLQGPEPGLIPTVERPFWRECIQIEEPHAAWGAFPAAFGIQYYALGTDRVLTTVPGQGQPLLRRLDTRQMIMEDYAGVFNFGRGQVILTTLRLEGGLGDQPTGITRSPAGMFLLAEWVRYLQSFSASLHLT